VGFDDRLDRVTVTAATGLYACIGPWHRPQGDSQPAPAAVGTAGLALGADCGARFPARRLTCDALVSASVVLPSGEAVTVTEDDHADLFWAMQGGGGGNFAVTTSMTSGPSPPVTPTWSGSRSRCQGIAGDRRPPRREPHVNHMEWSCIWPDDTSGRPSIVDRDRRRGQ